MAQVADVAERILETKGALTTMKLEKLVFYAQAYSLVERGYPLFDDRIEAWVNGPVVPHLYRLHRGLFMVRSGFTGRADTSLTPDDDRIIDRVIARLGELSGEELRELSHSERPWQNARKGLRPSDRGSREITKEAIASYYGALPSANPLFA